MKAAVVFESMWGNTEAVARAVAEGLGDRAVLVEVSAAGHDLADDVDLLVIGGPTHAFSMSRQTTRQDAARQGAPAPDVAVGIREWLADLPPSDRRAVATFDTRVTKVRRLPGSAAKKAAGEVRRRRLGRLLGTESFYVADVAGPLLDGELERARQWGADLVSHSPVA